MVIMQFLLLAGCLTGLIATLAPKGRGTAVIAGAAFLYSWQSGRIWGGEMLWLFAVSAVAEIGLSWLRRRLTRNFTISRLEVVSSIICHAAGIVALSALLRSFLLLTVWEVLIGKDLLPRLEEKLTVLRRLLAVAALRFLSGVIMCLIVLKYVII